MAESVKCEAELTAMLAAADVLEAKMAAYYKCMTAPPVPPPVVMEAAAKPQPVVPVKVQVVQSACNIGIASIRLMRQIATEMKG